MGWGGGVFVWEKEKKLRIYWGGVFIWEKEKKIEDLLGWGLYLGEIKN